MAGNLSPIFSKIGKIGFASAITLANTAKDGTGVVDIVFTADATNGSFLQKLKIRPKGTNVASVLRVFLNNGSVTTTAANNTLFDEISLPATTLSEVAALAGFEYPVNLALPAGYRLFVTLGTAVAGGYAVTGVGGDY
jgi:hypothetical protein